ncbi:protein FATTY ACID EXPORT 1 [Citrus sinensis]|nr:protein FATTY ACID EXPORT 1 [Citrus sinensis]
MTSSEIKTTLSYTADNDSKPYVEGTAKSYPTVEEEHSSGEMGKTEPVPEDGVAQPKKAAKIHDFCFGIPYGGLVLGGGLFGLIFSRNPATLRTALIGGALLALSTFSLKIWRQGKSSLPFILGQAVMASETIFLYKMGELNQLAPKSILVGSTGIISVMCTFFNAYLTVSHLCDLAVLSAVLLRQNFEAYSLTKKLFPTGFYAAISAAMLCFYSYVVASGGNPPPKKLKSSAAAVS